MKRDITLITLILTIFSFNKLNAQALIHFEKEIIYLGIVYVEVDSLRHQTNKDYVKVDFTFKNVGKEPLFISNVLGSGSGVANYSKEPVLPNATATIKITMARYCYDYNSKLGQDKDGNYRFSTSFTVSGNFPEKEKVIYIQGYRQNVQFNDTIGSIVTDSFAHNLGDIAAIGFKLVKTLNILERNLPLLQVLGHPILITFVNTPKM